jgi:DNA-binding MarR family transcriptional regulator
VESESILISIRKIIRAIHLESKKVQKTYGVSIPQLMVMHYLSTRPEFSARMGDINKFLHLNPSTVTGIISRLEMCDLVMRVPDVHDKRVSKALLTAKGLRLVENKPQLLHDRLAENLAKLPADRQLALSRAFSTVTQLLDIQDLDASPLMILEDPA